MIIRRFNVLVILHLLHLCLIPNSKANNIRRKTNSEPIVTVVMDSLSSIQNEIETVIQNQTDMILDTKHNYIQDNGPSSLPKEVPNVISNQTQTIQTIVENNSPLDTLLVIQNETHNFKPNLTENAQTVTESYSPIDPVLLTQNATANANYNHNENVSLIVENVMEVIVAKPLDESIYCPTNRYIPWEKKARIYRTRTLFFKLGYTASSWNFEPMALHWNLLEDYAWDTSTVADAYAELSMMGYNEDKWDCCINHYNDFDWVDLQYWNYTEQIKAFENLGWSAKTFGTTNETFYPESENQYWQNLTEYQRYIAASRLCYTEETWDQLLPIYDWPVGFEFPDAW